MTRRSKPHEQADPFTNALDQHASALLGGESTRKLRRQFKKDPTAEELFDFAEGVFQLAAQVEPSTHFVGDLKQELMGQHAQLLRLSTHRAVKRTTLTRRVMSIFAITALVARIVAPIIMLIALLVNLNRRRRSAPAL